MKSRLDQALVEQGMVTSRSQGESYIRLGKVTVNGKAILKPGFEVDGTDKLQLLVSEQYVSRAALKLASVSQKLKLDFKDKMMLDVGSSTGGFTDFALRKGARKVIAVDIGTEQLHPSLRHDTRIELHEKTDIRDFKLENLGIDIVTIDVSFISIREIMPAIKRLATDNTQIIAMIKPQFEAKGSGVKHKGVIKNDSMRRSILKDFEVWAQNLFVILDKADSEVSGSKGNTERFYVLKKLIKH